MKLIDPPKKELYCNNFQIYNNRMKYIDLLRNIPNDDILNKWIIFQREDMKKLYWAIFVKTMPNDWTNIHLSQNNKDKNVFVFYNDKIGIMSYNVFEGTAIDSTAQRYWRLPNAFELSLIKRLENGH